MDLSALGLDRRPFRPAVDPDAYFPADGHEAALAAVAAGFARRDPVVLLDGPTGVGKSLVARKWLEHLLPDVPRVVLPGCRAAGPVDLLQAILFDLGESYRGLTEGELRLAATGRLLDAAAESGYPTVVVVDEAQNLGGAAREELRLLGNLETRGGAAVFALLVAGPSLRAKLQRPGCEAFAQRVGVPAAVPPLTADEAGKYLRHQVRAAGGAAELFDEAAVAAVVGACGGVPRVLNRAAGLALELAAAAGAGVVDVEAALEALDRLGLAGSAEPAGPVLLPHPGRPAAGGDEAAPARVPKNTGARKRTA